MDNRIILTKNNGFGWSRRKGINVRGYVYLNGRYAENESVIDYLGLATDGESLVERIKGINGCFSIVVSTEYGLYAFSDTTRSFPLLYSTKDECLYISDSSEEIVSRTGYSKINDDGLVDYLHSGGVFYNETLVSGIRQVGAMHFLRQTGDSVDYVRYKGVYAEKFSVFDDSNAYELLIDSFRNASRRLVDSLKGRTAVVYLSGGVDSRACLMMLRMMDYRKVICVSYGMERWDEVKTAREVAGFLGYRHIVVEHERKQWRKTYRDTDSLDYIGYSFNLDAITHMESHYVTGKLCKNHMIPEDSVFLTGHIGIIANCKFQEPRQYHSMDLVEYFWKYTMKLYSFKGRRREHYSRRLEEYFGHDMVFDRAKAEAAFENAAYDTIRTKHIINYHRQFEFYGHEWRMPIMDHEIMKAFESISPPVRDIGKNLFKKLVINETTPGIGPSREPETFVKKAFRNLGNPVYSIMRPYYFITMGYKKCLLPPFPIRQYRFYRRFYSYCALREIRLVKEWIREWKQSFSEGHSVD